MNKFTDGLKFGLGFGLAFLAVLCTGLFLVLDTNPSRKLTLYGPPVHEGFAPSTSSGQPSGDDRELVDFGELNIEDQIAYASVIVLAKFEPVEDGKVISIITEILKKEEGVTFYYAVGDEYTPSSYYPRERADYGDGLLIFFTGSPATMRMSTTYRGDRVTSLGDIPIQLLREKCKASNT